MSLTGSQSATLQAAGLAAVSNVIAQTMRKSGPFDSKVLFQFVLWAFLTTPANYELQMWLERTFPGHQMTKLQEAKSSSRDVQATKKQNLRNIIIKFLFDQLISAPVNSLAFIAAFAYFRGENVWETCKIEFWPMRVAALKVWPLVSLLTYTVIPVEYRILFGNTLGLGWGIWLSLSVSK